MPDNKWARLLAYDTGLVNHKLLLQNEYLVAGNRILRAHLPARMRLEITRSISPPWWLGSKPKGDVLTANLQHDSLAFPHHYLREENRVLREQLDGRRLRLDDNQRRRLAVKAKALGRKVLADVASIVTPETLLAWHRKLIAQKYDGTAHPAPAGLVPPMRSRLCSGSSCSSSSTWVRARWRSRASHR
jgi:hypothetical protein